MDKRVEIHGTSRADMNGRRGVATDFHYDDQDDPSRRHERLAAEERRHERLADSLTRLRYTVQLDSGEAFKLKRANVRAERTGGGMSAGKEKAKGKKGKKGRGGRS